MDVGKGARLMQVVQETVGHWIFIPEILTYSFTAACEEITVFIIQYLQQLLLYHYGY